MKKPITISSFAVENVKRVQLVRHECDGQSLVVIGGKNASGKTSTLDAICWTLGGDRFKPSNPLHDGADKLATEIVLSNGIIVERTGASGTLKVTDPTGKKGGQTLLNSFISTFALDLPAFLNASAGDKAKMLLECFPNLGPELNRLNQEAKRIFGERHAHGQIADRKAKAAAEMTFHPDAPTVLITAEEMTARFRDALRVNSENDRKRRDAASILAKRDAKAAEVRRLAEALAKADAELREIDADLATATKTAASLKDEDTTAMQAQLDEMEGINAKVRENLAKIDAERNAEELKEQYQEMTRSLDKVRADRLRLLADVKMPLAGLEISEDGTLLYNGREWDGCSGMEQMRIAVAICASIKPECGFVLLDGLERMDVDQLHEFGAWMEERGLQAIGTRVGTGPENSIIIADGLVADREVEF